MKSVPLVDTQNINGVKILNLTKYDDSRGSLFEMYRNEWITKKQPIQWNIVHSKPNVIRGFHVHPNHADYLVCASGKFTIKMRDLRTKSSTYLQFQEVTLNSENPSALVIPPGVGHGFEFTVYAHVCYGLSSYWSLAEELDCRFDDKNLDIKWSVKKPLLSDRDNKSGSYQELIKMLEHDPNICLLINSDRKYVRL